MRTLKIKTFGCMSALYLSACGGGGGTPYGNGREGEGEGGEGEGEGEEPGGRSVCGNGVCDFGEAVDVCPDDCGDGRACGNGSCDADEDGTNCPIDCGVTGAAPCRVFRLGDTNEGSSLSLGVHCGSVHFTSCSCAECEAVWEAAQNDTNWAEECRSYGGVLFRNGCDDPNCSLSGVQRACSQVATPLECRSDDRCCALSALCSNDGLCQYSGTLCNPNTTPCYGGGEVCCCGSEDTCCATVFPLEGCDEIGYVGCQIRPDWAGCVQRAGFCAGQASYCGSR